jgi:hypothetical protein
MRKSQEHKEITILVSSFSRDVCKFYYTHAKDHQRTKTWWTALQNVQKDTIEEWWLDQPCFWTTSKAVLI